MPFLNGPPVESAFGPSRLDGRPHAGHVGYAQDKQAEYAKFIQALYQDPQAAAALQAWSSADGRDRQRAAQIIADRADALGIVQPDGTRFQRAPDGTVSLQHFSRLMDQILPAAAIFGSAGLLTAGAVSALAGAAPAASAAPSALAPAVAPAVEATAPGWVASSVGGTANSALGGTTALGALSRYEPFIRGGIAAADQASQNKQRNSDRALTMDSLRLNEIQGAETAQQQRARLALDQQQAERDATKQNYSMALQGALGRYTEDVHMNRDGFNADVPNISFSGGARPSAIGSTGRDNAAVLEALATRNLANPEARTVLPPVERLTIGADGRRALPLTPEEEARLRRHGGVA